MAGARRENDACSYARRRRDRDGLGARLLQARRRRTARRVRSVPERTHHTLATWPRASTLPEPTIAAEVVQKLLES